MRDLQLWKKILIALIVPLAFALLALLPNWFYESILAMMGPRALIMLTALAILTAILSVISFIHVQRQLNTSSKRLKDLTANTSQALIPRPSEAVIPKPSEAVIPKPSEAVIPKPSETVVVPVYSDPVFESKFKPHPTPTEIQHAIESQPPFHQTTFRRSYIGLKIKWELEFSSLGDPFKDSAGHNLTTMFARQAGDLPFPLMQIAVDLEEHIEIKTAKAGAQLTVYGTIKNVEVIFIYLTPEKLVFPS